MSGIQGKRIAITGASSGIGEAAARLLAEKGAHVILGARRTDRLETIVAEIRSKGGKADHHPLDVTKRDDAMAFVRFAVERAGRLDVLINNAGIMPLSFLEQDKVDEWDRTIDVNIKGILYGISAALPVMKKQGSGQFINLASVGGLAVVPTAAVYCASKFAVRAISEGLRQEVGRDIRVTIITPGAVESELAESISDPGMKEKVIKDYRQDLLPAAAIARAIVFAVEQPDDVDVNEIVVRPTAQGY
ncbi:SDR family oxidoreductase [Chondromyces apiculatus]|uniref:Short-chain dehydrogenase/reductase SDR n=1 Tax=Chondromyces apiculatus DSM 436 TaxID=1192034 RepID=A0A017TGD6_9BACT|nr:SDR family oxidoreductase [Chondromyces apiculatus]EYF08309.1 short-chain dehydrogenase/reductase SDR [Chondromyces apiculatus DSM 436]